jgi:type IV pilus assembly protein PilY1
VKWEYPNSIQPTASPGTDDDLGYGFGRAFIVKSRLGYVVIMGNGYQSGNGKAVLYVLDALTGALLGKIDTGVGSPAECNGLSVPVLIDPDFDGIADYAYAGDLLGNMWKFDLRGNSIANWRVSYNTEADGTSGSPMPLFQAKNKDGHRQPITTKPDVIAHPDSSLGGYMVVFGTGRYLGNADFGDNSVQTVYGIWDWAAAWEKVGGTSPDKYFGAFGPVTGVPEFGRLNYINKPDDTDFEVGQTVTGATSGATGVIEEIEIVGETAGSLKLKSLSTTNTFERGEFITSPTVSADAVAENELQPIAFRPLANLASHVSLAGVGQYVTLLEQTQIAFIQESRFMSDNAPYWFYPGGTSAGKLEHAGWYFDLPGANERMIRDPLIRNGIAFVISSIPSSSPCSSGGASIIHAMDATAGGRSLVAGFDISGPDGMPDGKIDDHDLVNIGTANNPHYVAPTGLRRNAMWYTPAVLAVANSETDVMYFSTSEGNIEIMDVGAEKVGLFFWREIE